MKTETLLYAKQGETTTTEDLIESRITRPLNNRELEEKIDELSQILYRVVTALVGELGTDYVGKIISEIADLQKDLR